MCKELGNTAKRPEDLLAGIKGWEGSFLQQCCSQSTLSGVRACLEGLAGELTLCNVLEGWRTERWRRGRWHPGERACVKERSRGVRVESDGQVGWEASQSKKG